MNYRIVALISFCSLFASCLYGQRLFLRQQSKVVVTEANDEMLIYNRVFTDEEINHLLSTKTVFLYPDTIRSSIDAFKQAVTSAWTLTPVTFDSYQNETKYISDTTISLMKIGAGGFRRYITSRDDRNVASTNISQIVHCYFTLQTTRSYTDAAGKNHIVANAFCRIELFPNHATSELTEWMQDADKLASAINEKGFFYNLTPVLLATHLHAVVKNVSDKMRPYLYADTIAPQLTTLLTTDTLYVPQSIMIHMRPLGGKESVIKDNLFKKYPFPYKMCSDAELFTIFETEKRGRLLFEYTKSVSDKFVSVWDVKDGALLYKKYTSGSYNLKEDDIVGIVKATDYNKK